MPYAPHKLCRWHERELGKDLRFCVLTQFVCFTGLSYFICKVCNVTYSLQATCYPFGHPHLRWVWSSGFQLSPTGFLFSVLRSGFSPHTILTSHHIHSLHILIISLDAISVSIKCFLATIQGSCRLVFQTCVSVTLHVQFSARDGLTCCWPFPLFTYSSTSSLYYHLQVILKI